MSTQRTLKKAIQATGIGLHSGEKVLMTLCPAPPNTGIVFRRMDLSPIVEIQAHYKNVGDTTLCTTIQQESVKIATVEHLLSACAGLGVDNAYVEVHGPELPIMDGSAKPFVLLIQTAGIREQNVLKRFLRIRKPLRVEDGEKYVQLLPYNGYKVTCTIEFDHPVFRDKPQSATFDFATASYAKEVAKARTFGFLHQYDELREKGLVNGGSLDNAIVVDNYRILNEGGLRFDSEFVAHKVLDAIGDLSMLGYSIIGAFEGYKSGHALNNRILHALIAHQESWDFVEFEKNTKQHDELPDFISSAIFA